MSHLDDAVVLAKRRAHEALIAEDPVSIAIHREEQVSDGAGGFIPTEWDLPPFTGRLVDTGRVKQVRATQAGSVEMSAWTLFAPATADVKRTATVKDTFRLPDGRAFEVVKVRPLSYKGQIYGYQAEVAEVM